MLIWTAGTILIVLSWVDVVSRDVGWIGFGIALFGVVLSAIPHVQAWFGNLPTTHHPMILQVDETTGLQTTEGRPMTEAEWLSASTRSLP